MEVIIEHSTGGKGWGELRASTWFVAARLRLDKSRRDATQVEVAP
jgi:hypothetical protein